MDSVDDLERQRAAAPIGTTVTGTISSVPSPLGVVGVFVDLGLAAIGFVDHGALPFDPADWPRVGQTTTFEVLQHRYRQIRLYPTDAALRRSPTLRGYTADRWEAIRRRYPIGAVAEMTVHEVFPGNRECRVTDGFLRETVEWSGDAPRPGTLQRYRVVQHLNVTQRVLLRSALDDQVDPGRTSLPPVD